MDLRVRVVETDPVIGEVRRIDDGGTPFDFVGWVGLLQALTDAMAGNGETLPGDASRS